MVDSETPCSPAHSNCKSYHYLKLVMALAGLDLLPRNRLTCSKSRDRNRDISLAVGSIEGLSGKGGAFTPLTDLSWGLN